MTGLSIGILIGVSVVAGAQLPPTSEWTRADIETVRVSPDRYPNLPAVVRSELNRRQCLIPQPFTATDNRLQNVAAGRFTSPSTTDWAVLCSRQRRSSILVFRGGGVAAIDELAADEDAGSLQVTSPGKIGYSRGIGVASPSFIRGHNRAANPPLPVLDHDGINDMFIEKGSIVWYWSGASWLKLAGADAPR